MSIVENEEPQPLSLSCLHTTLGLANFNSTNEIGWQVLAELINAARVKLVSIRGNAKGDVNDLLIESEEVLSNLTRPRISRVKGGNENRSLASRVELEMNAALRENCRFELLYSRVEREGQSVDVLCGRSEQSVLHHEANFELSFDYGQDLGSAGVRVRGIHPTWLKEGHCAADAVRAVAFARNEEREVLLVGDKDAATITADGGSLEVEGELVVDVFRVGDGDKVLDIVVDGQQLLQNVDLGQICIELFGELSSCCGVDAGRNERREAGGLAAIAAGARGISLHH